MSDFEAARIGLISVSDRASTGAYKDEGIPSLRAWLESALHNPVTFLEAVIPDEQPLIESTLKQLVDAEQCDLVLTTGGTGPALRDVTPRAWGQRFHRKVFVSEPAMRLITEHGGQP